VDVSIRQEFLEAGELCFELASCGEGERLALCLHGFPECWYSWRHQMPLLADLGYRVWAPNLRGYGRTTKPTRLQDYAIEKLVDDVAALVDAAAAASVTLISHDWGGVIAWYFAMRKVRPLERLVIMNAPHPVAAEPAFRTWKQLKSSWYAMFFQLPWLPEALLRSRGYRAVGEAMRRTSVNPERFPDEAMAVCRDAASQPGALTGMLNYYRAFVRGGGSARQKRLGTPVIDTPTLMIWGEQDVALTKATTYGTDAYVSDLTLRYLPDASHWVQQDEPDAVNGLLAAWLGGEPVPEVGAGPY
jgi:pimeloyl-ACP methyl ester carboxylesterase